MAIRLPEGAGDPVVAGPDPMEPVLDTRSRRGDVEGVPDPITHLLGVVKHPAGDRFLERFDLGRPEAAGVTAGVERAELVQAAIADDAEPLADLASRDAQQRGDLLASPPL